MIRSRSKTPRGTEIIMQLNTVQRAAAVVLTIVLLTVAGQGTAIAGDPQWESGLVNTQP
jgi:hypothetical protein